MGLICRGMAVSRIGMLGVVVVRNVSKIKALKVGTVTLIGEGRKNLTCFVY